jgi:hypothetical protein
MKLRLNWSSILVLVTVMVLWMIMSKLLGWIFAVAVVAAASYGFYRWVLPASRG